MADTKPGRVTINRMALVRCPIVGNAVVWANATKDAFRCTKCGATGHTRV